MPKGPKGERRRARSPEIASRSDCAQIAGIGLAGSLVRDDVEANFLAFLEIVHPGTRDGADVDENVPAAPFRLDEAKAFLGIKPLYLSGRHIRFLSRKCAGVHRRTGDAYLDVPELSSRSNYKLRHYPAAGEMKFCRLAAVGRSVRLSCGDFSSPRLRFAPFVALLCLRNRGRVAKSNSIDSQT